MLYVDVSGPCFIQIGTLKAFTSDFDSYVPLDKTRISPDQDQTPSIDIPFFVLLWDGTRSNA